MKYYISDNKVFNIKNVKKILNSGSFIKNSSYYLMIFSLDGIFKIDTSSNKNIKKIHYHDKMSRKITIENLDILEDSSETYYTESYQIPLEHSYKKIEHQIYKTRENALLKFHILKDFEEIVDFYFETNENINNLFVIEDLATFLSF